ncbi:transglycosylase domain-containing protein [Bradyrhizobium sp. LHD-71]|uniref:transglycosylase domain-containing protein n=1 Tax=Bradyrhizobium sp. LHD-71 TaxID=3072141 RepID=UPI00280C86B7|nr:transglycosylase domain-containing protein [Bradyrhizobium sp. LHD-71]MDQ8730128.1 transglycosylase domain-containing protein [Bradyrhizobium sp. LHD-71]
MGTLVGLPFVWLSLPPERYYSLDQIQPQVERRLVLLSADGEPFARRGGCVDEPVRVSDVPQHFIDALLSMEDRRFHSHFGVDPLGIARAAYRNWKAGHVIEGGSTITQQLVKFSFLSKHRTMERKRDEALLAVWLELALTKDQILELYLSNAYFGGGCFGLRAAAKRYFGKQPSALTLAESALLVGRLKSPTSLTSDFNAAQERAKLVLQAMVDNGRLPATRLANIAWTMPLNEQKTLSGGYYADWLAGTVQLPDSGSLAPVPVHTSFQPRLQRSAEEAIESVLAKQERSRHATQAALVAMRPDGRVVAMVGGRDHNKSQFNRAVQARRQPGSSFKLFVYLAALRAGATPDTMVIDEPISIGDYEPKNFDNNYQGDVSLRQAFASSINTVAVRLSETVGRNNVIDVARDLGITTPLEPTASLALGTWEVQLLELTSAYAAVAAGAYPVKPWGITSLGYSAKTAAPPRDSGRWLLTVNDPLRELLEETVRSGSGQGAQLPITTFGKTGTSQAFRDAWFMGFAGNLVVGVWVGNDDYSPMKNVTGGSLPAQIWRSFMTKAMRSDPNFQRKPQQTAVFPAAIRENGRASRRATLEFLDATNSFNMKYRGRTSRSP